MLAVGLSVAALALACLLALLWVYSDERTVGELLRSLLPKTPPEATEPVPERVRVKLRPNGGTAPVEGDALYKAVRSGMPVGFEGDEHTVTLEVMRRVRVMVLNPMEERARDLERQLAQVRLANRMLKEVSNAQEQEATGLSWFEERNK